MNSDSKSPVNIAIVGGTGFETLPPEIFSEEVVAETSAGVVRALSVSNNYAEPGKLYFVSRHGASHGLAPHQINYRANTELFQQLGVKYVLATNAVGSLRTDLAPGSLVLLNDFIDMTRSRDRSLFAGSDWKHVDFTEPYSRTAREAIERAAAEMDIPILSTGTYICVDGPRFETPAEVRLFGSWGADVVGMTGVPEVVMAKEAGLEYASVCIVTNYGAGLAVGEISHDDVVHVMGGIVNTVRELLMVSCKYLPIQQ
jgi:5'-methylthioadenosine phosphorylase